MQAGDEQISFYVHSEHSSYMGFGHGDNIRTYWNRTQSISFITDFNGCWIQQAIRVDVDVFLTIICSLKPHFCSHSRCLSRSHCCSQIVSRGKLWKPFTSVAHSMQVVNGCFINYKTNILLPVAGIRLTILTTVERKLSLSFKAEQHWRCVPAEIYLPVYDRSQVCSRNHLHPGLEEA